MKHFLQKLTRAAKKNRTALRLALGTAFFSSAVLFTGEAQAQLTKDYNFEAISGTFTPLPATATQVPLMQADSYLMPATTFPNGFTFHFNGATYSSFRASSDGYLSFGTGTGNIATNNLFNNNPSHFPLLAPLWDNLDGQATGGSKASYEVSGTPGSQVFTFEWLNWEFSASSTTPVISFQVKLYEADGKIEFVYRSESGNVVNGSASIGIAGSGNNNAISVHNTSANPVISRTQANNQINTKPATGQIYAFSKPVTTDISAIALAQPSTISCYGPNQTVAISVKNTGTSALDFSLNPLTVSASASGPNPETFAPVTVNSGILNPGESQAVVVSTTYNMSAYGTYTFHAAATVTTDGFIANNAMPAQTRTNVTPTPLPHFLDFTGFTSNLSDVAPLWNEAGGEFTPNGKPYSIGSSTWMGDNFVNNSGHANGKAAMFNFYDFNTHAWIVSPKFMAVPNAILQYDLALTPWGSSVTSTMGSDDIFRVLISTDCGNSYSVLRTYNASTPISNTGQRETIDLNAYAGQPVMIAFYATDGPVTNRDNELFLDNIFAGVAPVIDAGLTALANPLANGCYTANEPVTATIRNFHTAPLDLSVNPATVTINVTGAVTQTLTATVNTGIIAPGATLQVNAGSLNMMAAGTYTFQASVNIAGDGFPFNNELPATTRIVKPTASLPQQADLTGFNGSNLNTLFPNWSEAKGTTLPTGTASNWVQATGLGGTGNITARLNIYGTGSNQNEWLVGPKVLATANTHFQFKAAITASNSLSPTTNTMDADDKVYVMVSADCGLTYTPVYTIAAGNTLSEILKEQRIPLGNYAGQQIMVAIYATGGTVSGGSSYDFHVDDLSIMDIYAADLGATALMNPPVSNGCFETKQPVRITIRNHGTAPLDFTTQPATVTVQVSGAVTQTLTLNLNTNTANNGNPLLPGASVTVLVDSLNMFTPGNYTFNATASVANDGNFANNAMPGATATVTGPVAGTASVSATSVCYSSPVTLNLSGSDGLHVQWQQANAVTGPFTDIPGATTTIFTTGNLLQNTYFRTIVSCGSLKDTSNTAMAAVLPSAITATTGDTLCLNVPSGSATLSAMAPAGGQVSWYSAATGGTPVATGNTFTSTVSATTTFYAEATAISNTVSLNAHAFNGFFGCAGGSMFDVLPSKNINIQGFDQNLSTAAGNTVTIYIFYKNGTYKGAETNASAWTALDTITVTSAGPGNATYIPVKTLALASGQLTGIYILAPVKFTTILTPVTYSNADLLIEPGAGLCNPFAGLSGSRDWDGAIRYTFECTSARIPVTAVVNQQPAMPSVVFAPGSRGIICHGDSSTLIANNTTPGVTYQWLNNGVAIPGATSATYVAKETGAFVAVASSAPGCSSSSVLYTVTVNPKPATPTITQNGPAGHELTSSAATGNQWYLNGKPINGATSYTYQATANGNYTVITTNQNGCTSDTSAAVNITNTGIKGEMAGMSVSVYPNPSNGKFNVKLTGYKQDAAIELYSLTGQLIVKETAKAGREVMPMQVKNLAAGTYLLKVVSEKGVQVSKLVVE